MAHQGQEQRPPELVEQRELQEQREKLERALLALQDRLDPLARPEQLVQLGPLGQQALQEPPARLALPEPPERGDQEGYRGHKASKARLE
jgi:hypothetical protein